MHGRVKVRSSEEEKARKEKERKEKLKLYQHAMQKINSKRSSGELDRELLGITGQVLSSNPDIYTLWNIRRETFNILTKTIEASEDLSKLYNDELYLTEYCLKINPKSYCAWHQREWVLTTRSDPDWKKELEICDKYIKLDERNFHTWDYRRFVVGQCKPPLKEEFDFTTEKIHENFSNYSAWHYRSKMLLELYPDLEAGRPIEDSHHKQELELVLNAAFTDPDDTSAWFYQRWLLGAVKDSLQAVNCTIALSKTTVAFNKSVSEDLLKTKIQILFNGEPIDGHWESCTGNQYDNLWIFKHSEEISEDLDIRVEFETENGEKQTIPCHKQKHSKYIGKADIVFQKQYSEPVLAELKKQLVSCRQLLDLEPDSKWTLLTTTIFLHCIDAKQYYKESIANLEKLKIVDKLRSGYYHDLITKWSIEEQLTSSYTQNVDSDLKILFNEKITNLPHLQYYSYCEKVDLSNQNLNSAIFPFLGVLQHCKELNLENNMLSTLKGFPNLSLDIVNLKGNPDLDEEETRKYAATVQYKVIY